MLRNKIKAVLLPALLLIAPLAIAAPAAIAREQTSVVSTNVEKNVANDSDQTVSIKFASDSTTPETPAEQDKIHTIVLIATASVSVLVLTASFAVVFSQCLRRTKARQDKQKEQNNG